MNTYKHGVKRNPHLLHRFSTTKKLIVHLQESHGREMDTSTFTFENLDDFLEWKSIEESTTKSSYVQQCAYKSFGNNWHWYYYCNHAGKYAAKGKCIRQLKRQGSGKIGNQCTAHMAVTQNLSTNQVMVEYCATHNRHEKEVAHLRMSNELKMKLAAKLQQGVSIDKILDDIRDTFSPRVTRKHLVTRKDIQNIMVQHNIEGIIRHKNDLTSVSAWVEEMRQLCYNPILAFKQQGEE